MHKGCSTMAITTAFCDLCFIININIKHYIMTNIITRSILALLMIIGSLGHAQETLDTVVVNYSNPYTYNDFKKINLKIANTTTTTLRELLKNSDKTAKLTYRKGSKVLIVSQRKYIRALRKSLKKSNSFKDFTDYLSSIFPTLREEINGDMSLRDIYMTMQNTSFNTYVANLPSVL